jgi:LmbE family N-acetylglucosaminyl deacetylase
MTASVPKDVAARVFRILDSHRGATRLRVLAIGRSAPIWGSILGARGCEVTLQDGNTLPAFEGGFDIALVTDAIEHAQWDRWLLQRVHLALGDHGHLVLVATNLTALGSVSDIGFIAGRVLKQIRIRLRASIGLPPARGTFTGRRYRSRDLGLMLDSLGFRVLETSASGGAWPGGSGLHRRHVLICERGPSLFGLDPRRPFPPPALHAARFEPTQRRFIEDRRRWLARHRDHAHQRSKAFDPTGYRDAEVLVLSPHPDDEVIGCGGTLARLIGAGARVTVIHATDGSEAASLWNAEPSVRRTVRLDEATEVGRAMGFAAVELWREDNAAFQLRDELVARLARTLADLRPRLIFVPFVTDIHPDHRTLSRILAAALATVSIEADVLNYQVWSLVPRQTHCIVTDEMHRLERVTLLYETAMKVEDYVHFCQDRNYHNAYTRGLDACFAEVFYQVPAREYAALLATVGRPHG